MPVDTIRWHGRHIRIIDQTLLPGRLVYRDLRTVASVAEAIRTLAVRGAPAIGIAGAMGVALAAVTCREKDRGAFDRSLGKSIEVLSATRPTAVNLFWALRRMKETAESDPAAPPAEITRKLVSEAEKIYEEDREVCRRIGMNGAALLPRECTVLTHCNAGGLATADYGTALGVITSAKEMGKSIRVFADETRPLLQGSRLTAWELEASHIDVTVICDSAAASLMKKGKIDAVIVGADWIASNGDVVNKIGTYSLAVLANAHRIPFYVAAPLSTFDFSIRSGDRIVIEERPASEVTMGFGRPTAPANVAVYNPAFDATPHTHITAIITEAGVFYPPYRRSLKKAEKSLSAHFFT